MVITAKYGQGPVCPNRSGDICIDDVMNCLKKGMALEGVRAFAFGEGGLLNLCGTDDLKTYTGKPVWSGLNLINDICHTYALI